MGLDLGKDVNFPMYAIMSTRTFYIRKKHKQ